jgi:cellulose synthase/poly-beta-1,6-N-acetylglucosamine synthase-like glycosyltransferase
MAGFLLKLFLFLPNLLFAYFVSLLIVSLLPIKIKKNSNSEKYNIAVIPAHNEEKVILSILIDLLTIKFDKIYVLLDSCTDKTKDIILDLGYDIKIFEDNLRSKSKMLSKYLPIIAKENKNAYIWIFDADNRIIQKNFLQIANKYDDDILQVYCTNKITFKNPLSFVYAILYEFFRRINKAFTILDFGSVLGGSGERIKSSVINNYGFQVNTLTDDLEYTLKVPLKVKYIDDIVVFQEVPNSVKAMFMQLSRWIKGNIQNFTLSFRKPHILLILLSIFVNMLFLPLMLFTTYFKPINLIINAIFLILWNVKRFENIFGIPIYLLFFLPMLSIIYIYSIITYDNKEWIRTQHFGGAI